MEKENTSYRLVTVECLVPLKRPWKVSEELFRRLCTCLFKESDLLDGTPAAFKVKGVLKQGKMDASGGVVVDALVEFLVFK
ncbi:hypothetical protein ECANGB1_1315 [Enterospora canceri]|uniref:Uncharacterized protein n=1 Tax=Enterospora canceri TaxID=1081671 RepID=A0A1Y1S6A7_9MICR|nr:hypothetical protein ECANGB1_1315 [Enterospora canceri]